MTPTGLRLAYDRRGGQCRGVPSPFHAADRFPNIEELKQVEYPITANVIMLLIEAVPSVPVHDRALVNLYANLGNADPLVVATAIDAQRTEEAALVGPTWIVVSGDKAMQAKAREFGLAVKINQEFLADLELTETAADD